VVWAPAIDLAAIRSRWRGLPFVHVCATALSLTPLDLVVWAKANAGAGNLYRSQHELLPLFTSEINNDPRLPLVADTVAKVENRSTLKISQKPMFRRLYVAMLGRPDTNVRGRFCAKRCGPSRRRLRNASAVFIIFVCCPEKTFATVSALFGRAVMSELSPE
jgi:hypothetical protein